MLSLAPSNVQFSVFNSNAGHTLRLCACVGSAAAKQQTAKTADCKHTPRVCAPSGKSSASWVRLHLDLLGQKNSSGRAGEIYEGTGKYTANKARHLRFNDGD